MWDLGYPSSIWLSSSLYPHYGIKAFYPEEPFLYPCYPPPSWMHLSKFTSGHLQTKILAVDASGMENQSMVSDISSTRMQRKDDTAGLQDCKGKCRLWLVMGPSETWVYSMTNMN